MKVEKLNDYKNNLNSALSRDLSEFEKNFLLISGATLAFTITFIKEIVKIESAQNLCLLYISWVFIIISIGLMMYAFLKSANDCDKLWKIVDDFIYENKLFDDKYDLTSIQADSIKKQINETYYGSKSSLKGIRKSSVISFVLGIIFLALFTSINLNFENKSTSNIKQSEYKIERIVVEQNNQTLKFVLYDGQDSIFIDIKAITNTKLDATISNTSISTSFKTKSDASTKKR